MVDLQTTTGETRREDNADTSQDISSLGSLTGTLSGETKKSLQQQELPGLVKEEQRQ